METTISILKSEALSPHVTLLRLSNGIAVKCTKWGDDGEETREVLILDEADMVIDSGPRIYRQRRFGSTDLSVEVSWSSGQAKGSAEVEREIEILRVAAWMALELELIA